MTAIERCSPSPRGLTLDNTLIKVSAADGVIAVSPIHVDLYQGTLDGGLRLDARGEKPAYAINQKLAGFQFGDFLLDFMQKDPVSGAADVDIDLRTGGDWLSQLKANLNGKLDVAVHDGALKGFNLRYEIDKAKASFKGEDLGDREVQQTDFSALSLSGVVNDGVFASDQLDLQAPLLRVGGSGKIEVAASWAWFPLCFFLRSLPQGFFNQSDCQDTGQGPGSHYY